MTLAILGIVRNGFFHVVYDTTKYQKEEVRQALLAYHDLGDLHPNSSFQVNQDQVDFSLESSHCCYMECMVDTQRNMSMDSLKLFPTFANKDIAPMEWLDRPDVQAAFDHAGWKDVLVCQVTRYGHSDRYTIYKTYRAFIKDSKDRVFCLDIYRTRLKKYPIDLV